MEAVRRFGFQSENSNTAPSVVTPSNKYRSLRIPSGFLANLIYLPADSCLFHRCSPASGGGRMFRAQLPRASRVPTTDGSSSGVVMMGGVYTWFQVWTYWIYLYSSLTEHIYIRVKIVKPIYTSVRNKGILALHVYHTRGPGTRQGIGGERPRV